MAETAPKILAIDQGTRHLGVAVLEGTDLVFATVKSLKQGKMKRQETIEKCRKIIARLILDYAPDIIALEKSVYVQCRKSPLLQAISREIKKEAQSQMLPISDYAPTTVRKFICQNEKATQMNAACIIATRYYPWLYQCFEKDQRKKWWEEKYWARMFDAIALGLMCLGSGQERSGDVKAA